MQGYHQEPSSFDDYLKQAASRGRTMLLPALLEAQSRFGYISPEIASEIATSLRVPLADITGVIEFYRMLYDTPTAETIIRVCTRPTCSSQGAKNVLKELHQTLSLAAGQATEDGKYYLEKVKCLGLCDQAPSALVGQSAIGHADSPRILHPSGELRTAIYADDPVITRRIGRVDPTSIAIPPDVYPLA